VRWDAKERAVVCDILGAVNDELQLVQDNNCTVDVWLLKVNPANNGFSWAIVKKAFDNDMVDNLNYIY
jgi:hypothetical protein